MLCEAGKDEISRQEYVEMLPRVLGREEADEEARREAERDLVVALGGAVCLVEGAPRVE